MSDIEFSYMFEEKVESKVNLAIDKDMIHSFILCASENKNT
jgi:hypothetical protein